MDRKYLISLDQGTTSSKCFIFDRESNIISSAQKEFEQIYPNPGWVEHNPMDIFDTQLSVLYEAIKDADINAVDIAAIGISNQRETVIVWDKKTGLPVYNAIVWQCRRTSDVCEKIKSDSDLSEYIKEKTGLVIDAYFSATKIMWILDNIEGARQKADSGDLLFGTVDTWLLWKLTGGKVHATDYTNASRTMIFNIKELCWDQRILDALNIPRSMLPEVKNSSDNFGTVDIQGCKIPIGGVAGDQQAALFGQACFEVGDIKNTYGTGNFILMNTGETAVSSQNGLLTTIAYGIDGKITYALEGSVFIGGAVLQWLRDEISFIGSYAEANECAAKVPDNGGVYFVPAFTGLGAPHWDMYARGTIFGLTRGTTKNHIIRAALESIAFQSKDVFDSMMQSAGIDLTQIKVDGGASVSDIVMQFQSDISSTSLLRPLIRETTALGVAYLAGHSVGVWESLYDIRKSWGFDKEYIPRMDEKKRMQVVKHWNNAVSCTKLWHV